MGHNALKSLPRTMAVERSPEEYAVGPSVGAPVYQPARPVVCFGRTVLRTALFAVLALAGVYGATHRQAPLRMIRRTLRQPIRVELPANYHPGRPAPLILYAHGAGQDADSIVTDPLSRDFFQFLKASGCIVASADLDGDNWGNQRALEDYVAMYRYVRAHYTIGPVIIAGQSMGGLVALLGLADPRIEDVAGAFLVYPVCDLDCAWSGDTGPFAPAIRRAYGIAEDGSNYAAKTAGHRPLELPGNAFRGVPVWVCGSASDRAVPLAPNAAALVERLSPFAAVSYHRTAGDHGDPSNFDGAAQESLGRALASWLKGDRPRTDRR